MAIDVEYRFLTQILPKKYSNKERFRDSEVMEIFDLSRMSLYLLRVSGELTPIFTSDRRMLYTREELENYLTRINQVQTEGIHRY